MHIQQAVMNRALCMADACGTIALLPGPPDCMFVWPEMQHASKATAQDVINAMSVPASTAQTSAAQVAAQAAAQAAATEATWGSKTAAWAATTEAPWVWAKGMLLWVSSTGFCLIPKACVMQSTLLQM